ncbi:MAG: sulfurtransferase-like selenium metabolism protein YedF [Deltaproteobacteria bacterium]|nr:sulfurtransferase-like selenium metabolism protein YedF [Deltaproteobacteria bacterium]
MTVELDCRGLACPAPVLQTKQKIEKEDLSEISVIVDNQASKENVSRFLASQKFEVSAEQRGSDYYVSGKRGTAATESERAVAHKPDAEKRKIMVMIATDRMGFGDDDLGKKLIISFVKTLAEMGDELWRLVLVNNGVKLTIDGSEVLNVLKDYEKEGLTILVCGTCLNHFNLLDKKRVGVTTNMLDIVTAMQLAEKVINL